MRRELFSLRDASIGAIIMYAGATLDSIREKTRVIEIKDFIPLGLYIFFFFFKPRNCVGRGSREFKNPGSLRPFFDPPT